MEENQMNQEENQMNNEESTNTRMYSQQEVENIIKNVELSIMKNIDREQWFLSLKLECLKIAEKREIPFEEITNKAEELFKYIINGK